MGRSKNSVKFETHKVLVVYPNDVMLNILKSPKLDPSLKNQLDLYHKKSQPHPERKDLRFVEEIHRKEISRYGRLIGVIKKSTKEFFAFTGAQMWNNVRNLLFRSNYWDVDMVNCHFKIAESLFKKYELPCDKVERYINNREQCLQEVVELAGGAASCTRDSAKALFLRIAYGGKIKN